MKLFHKIFICFVVLFGIAFQVAGYLLISFSYEKVVEQEKRFAVQEFQHNKYIMLSVLYSDSGMAVDNKIDFNGYADNFSVPVAIYGTDGSCIYSNLSVPFEPVGLDEIEDSYVAYQINRTATESYILVSGLVSQNEAEMYLVTERDVSSVVNSENSMISYFQKIYLLIICFGFPVILLLSNLLVHSINKVSKAAKRIAEGRYTERIETSSKDEIGELAANFNHMAENIEENMAELSNQAQQKEEFAANFAHELKTPLTSVIGYADMLYQKNLPRAQVKKAAEYILNEGMRLEALSLKLMDLFVMDKQVFSLEEMSVREIFENLKQGIEPICASCGVQFHMKVEDGRIKVDYDLFKSIILNLVDNSIKADCKDIWIAGDAKGGIYRICLEDNGKGIPPEELGRITEAFYMVDKSRARKLHGAGLGMALVSKVIDIHGARMKIESDGKNGTKITLSFMQKGENER
ncbi:MAG: HAMP domain-containing histidine kinase [Lachnospiraceae bacterium]|nr:HAMP domain-containing histidine kinase [Lachnospiraceae bacterium]